MSRPDVLLLHGQPGGARDWNRVLAQLGDRVGAIAIDRPGWDGRSRPLDLAGNAQAALAALDARGIARATIVGHSLGGAVAARLALDAPERVAALVLAAPAANRASLEWFDRWLTFPVAGPLTTAASLTGLGLALSLGPVRGWLARRAQLDPGYLQAAGRSLLTGWARHAFTVEQQALVHEIPGLESRLGEIIAPTWIVTGSADRVVPAHAPQALAGQIGGARLVVLARAGHLLPQLHAGRLAETIVTAAAAAAGPTAIL
ncbi:MAG TPA: alpha/beta hydrolase [Solirubrobacteraceae bacterium]|nr:alpha/beta hydrolase [Solirubrobacteraceae bacterium]